MVLLSERFIASAATMSKMTQDAKKDEFRKYLEKAGVLELLTKSLVSVSYCCFLFVLYLLQLSQVRVASDSQTFLTVNK